MYYCATDNHKLKTDKMSTNKKLSSKGKRLGWTPLTEVKKVSLSEFKNKGRQVSAKEFKKAQELTNSSAILVP